MKAVFRADRLLAVVAFVLAIVANPLSANGALADMRFSPAYRLSAHRALCSALGADGLAAAVAFQAVGRAELLLTNAAFLGARRAYGVTTCSTFHALGVSDPLAAR